MNTFNEIFDVDPINTPSIQDLVSSNQEELLSLLSFENEGYVSAVEITLFAQLRFKDPDLKDYVCSVRMSALENEYDFEYFLQQTRDDLGEMDVVDILNLAKDDHIFGEEMTKEQQETASMAVRMKLMMQKLSA